MEEGNAQNRDKRGENTKNARVEDTLMNFITSEGAWTGPPFLSFFLYRPRVRPEKHEWEL